MFFPAQTAPVWSPPRGGPQALGFAHLELAAQDCVQVGMQKEQSSGDLSPQHTDKIRHRAGYPVLLFLLPVLQICLHYESCPFQSQ